MQSADALSVFTTSAEPRRPSKRPRARKTFPSSDPWIVLTAALTLCIALGIYIIARADVWRNNVISSSAGMIAGTLIAYCVIFIAVCLPLMFLAWFLSGKSTAAARVACLFCGIALIAVTGAAHLHSRASRMHDNEDAKLLLTAVGTWMEEARAQSAQFQKDMNAIAGKGLIRPEQLDSAEKIAASRAALQKVRVLVKGHHDQGVAFAGSLVGRIRALKINDRSKEDAVTGYLSSASKSKAVLDEWLMVEIEGIDRMGKLADFMESRLGQFRVENGAAVFQAGNDVVSYNALMARINEIVDKEKALSAKQQQMADEARDSITRLLKQAT